MNTRQPASVNIIDHFSKRAKKVIEEAAAAAREVNSASIDTEHLLIGLCEEEEMGTKILEKLGINPDDLKNYLKENLIEGTEEKKQLDLSPRAKKTLELAFYIAREMGLNYVGSEHILLGLIKEGEGMAAQALKKYKVSFDRALEATVKSLGGKTKSSRDQKEKTESKTPHLDSYSIDLTKQAKEGKLDPVIGRSDEITRVIQVLSRRTKSNPVLIGEPGVGKTAIAEGLAQKVVSGNIPENLQKKRVVALDLASMVSGTKFRGEFEKRLKKVIKEIQDSNKDIILFIDELHTIVGAGASEGSIDASNIIKPSLARGELQAIGATTLDEYKKHIEKDSALERRFQPILVGEPNVDVTIEILKGLRDKYEAHHKIKISTEAMIAAAHLSDRYIQDRFLPDKAIDLIDEAAAKIRLASITTPDKLKELETEIKRLSKEKEASEKAKNRKQVLLLNKDLKKVRSERKVLQESWNKEKGTGKQEVTPKDIEEVLSKWTGIPVSDLASEETQKLLKLEKNLHGRIVGQEEAVTAVSEAIRRGRAGLKDPSRPVGSFIFLGPTGVGKTELTKALAYLLFGDEDAMIRIDMSEYMERHTVSRLIGSPPGYVGHEEGGQLTEKVRRKPYSVILLDEIEKAHPDIFNVLLQILDDGRLTDAKGRTVDFKNTVIIATSNVGSNLISEASDKDFGFTKRKDKKRKQSLSNKESSEHLKHDLMGELKKTFRPEFLNRVDEVIFFHALNQKQIRKIIDLMLEKLNELLAGQNIELEVSTKAKNFLAKEGYDPTFGARPLRRVIQKKIENPLSTQLLEGGFKEGDKVLVDVSNKGVIEFEKSKRK
ncbi:AAA family ATPase [Patescibacteria group bacterium]|nr:AAA family ATPase [Patescibacteria group bacterium]